MKSFIASAFLGWAALAVVNLASSFSGVSLPVSTLSISASGALGIPGVILMLILQFIL